MNGKQFTREINYRSNRIQSHKEYKDYCDWTFLVGKPGVMSPYVFFGDAIYQFLHSRKSHRVFKRFNSPVVDYTGGMVMNWPNVRDYKWLANLNLIEVLDWHIDEDNSKRGEIKMKLTPLGYDYYMRLRKEHPWVPVRMLVNGARAESYIRAVDNEQSMSAEEKHYVEDILLRKFLEVSYGTARGKKRYDHIKKITHDRMNDLDVSDSKLAKSEV